MWPITSLVNIKESSTDRFTNRFRHCYRLSQSGCKGVCPLLGGVDGRCVSFTGRCVLQWEGELGVWLILVNCPLFGHSRDIPFDIVDLWVEQTDRLHFFHH